MSPTDWSSPYRVIRAFTHGMSGCTAPADANAKIDQAKKNIDDTTSNLESAMNASALEDSSNAASSAASSAEAAKSALEQVQGIGSNIIFAYLVSAGPSNAIADADYIKMPDVEAIRRELGADILAATGVMSNFDRMLIGYSDAKFNYKPWTPPMSKG